MRSTLTCDGENRLRVVARRAHEGAHNLGRRPVVNRNRVREVLLANEMKGNGRTTRFDVVSPKRRQSVGVIVSGIPIVPNPEQTPLQKPDHGGSHDGCAERILAVLSNVALNLKAQGRNGRREQNHAGELVVTGKISGRR